MSRRLTILFAALEAGLVVVIGIALPLVLLTVLWAVHFGFGVDWTVFWRAALDIWLLGHGVDVRFRLDEASVELLGIAGAAEPVPITIALLGVALVTLLLAARSGRRIAETGHRLLGVASSVAATAVLSLGLTALSLHDDARPSLVQAAILPPLVMGLGIVVGMLTARRLPTAPPRATPLARRLAGLRQAVPEPLRASAVAALRSGLGTVALTLAAAAVLLAGLLIIRYAEVIRLYEVLHGEVLGGVVVTAAELALLPNAVIWTASWLFGPGFALGAGSQVSPLGTALGPVPALPVLGAIPPGDSPFAFAGLLVPAAAAVLVGAAARRRLHREGRTLSLASLIGVALAAAAIGGLATGLLVSASAGAAGPGRLAVVGPDPLAVGFAAALIIAVAGGIGLAVGGSEGLSRVALGRRRDR